MELMNFQKKAVNELSETFFDLWKTYNRKIPLVFEAPTGAGKTIMMAEFLRCLDVNFQFQQDKAYIWISFGGDSSYTQSKNKLFHYFNDGVDITLKDVSNLNEGKLNKNNVFFINWSKIKASDKESKKLRRETEQTENNKGIFDNYIENTKREREIILIVDEAHREAGEKLPLYNEIIELLDPKIIIKVTATPENIPNVKEIASRKAGYVFVEEKDVIDSGLIKEQIVIQTEEEIKSLEDTKLNEDEKMLELAFNKRLELKEHYSKLGLKINPLVLIQLPSDFKEKAELKENKKEITLNYLKSKKVLDEEIAIWLDKEHKNLDGITENDSKINFMIFKEAPATGWDCPRADILVMFREIKSPVFHTQIIGRIKRMPEAKHYEDEILNKAYLYTNYNKNHIRNVKETETPNKIPIYYSKLKNTIVPINFKSTFISRVDFNTLEVPTKWQKSFLQSFNKYFGTYNDEKKVNENRKIFNKKINLSITKVDNSIVVNAKINSFDNFVEEMIDKGKDISYSFSEMDVEKLYNLLCFNELKKQEDEKASYNASRSWSPLKMAINVYFEDILGYADSSYYPIVVSELLNENSELKKAIYKALVDFRPIHDSIVKEKNEEFSLDINIPNKENSFTDDYEEIGNIHKNAYDKFYLLKDYTGKQNELKFINDILEKNKNIIWWHKQKNDGKTEFSIKYYNSQDKKNNLFYPDFIIETKKSIYIIDTKLGLTAKSKETADKAEALQKWIKDNKTKYEKNIVGGIVIPMYPNWKINKKDKYVYEKEKDWENLEIV